MFVQLLDTLFPRRSLQGEEGADATEYELSVLRACPIVLRRQALRSAGIRSLDRVVAAHDYRACPMLRTAIHRLKYRRSRALSRALGSVLLQAMPVVSSDVVLCPVPLHWRRYCVRGFNQSAVLAEALHEQSGYACTALLRRTRHTGQQAGRSGADRRLAMQSAFAMRSHAVIPSHVILIDDVYTTGSTLDACAAALRASGVKRVEALVLAKG